MPGRTHRALPGEPTCPIEGCDRPAGFATDHRSGPCRRHGGRAAEHAPATREPAPEPARTLEPVYLAEDPGAVRSAVEERLRGPGRASPKPLALVGVIVAAGRAAGLSFEEVWEVAAITALGYMSERRAREWAEVFDSTVRAWDDAYHGRRSPLQALPREVPAALGYSEPTSPVRRTVTQLPA